MIGDKLCPDGSHVRFYQECKTAAEGLGVDFYFAPAVKKCYAADIVQQLSNQQREFNNEREICTGSGTGSATESSLGSSSGSSTVSSTGN